MTATCPLMGSDGPSIGDFWKVHFRAAKVRSNAIRCYQIDLHDGKAAGAIEAKKKGATLNGVEIQSGRYALGRPT